MEDDALLMERVRVRDGRAFESLYDRHHRLVYGIAIRIMGQVAAAEDVTQAVFLKVWSSPEAFERGNFPAWIGRITRNRCLDLLRKKARHGDEPLSMDASRGEAAEDAAFARIDAAAVQDALSHIAPEQRTLIELAFFGGMTQARIAERTGVPLGTVKTRIRTGLQRLRQALDESGIA